MPKIEQRNQKLYEKLSIEPVVQLQIVAPSDNLLSGAFAIASFGAVFKQKNFENCILFHIWRILCCNRVYKFLNSTIILVHSGAYKI